MRAVDADHQHGGERGELDAHPHHADVVGDEGEVHGEHQHLIHGVIEAQEGWRQPAGLKLVLDIARAEHACGEADKGGEHDEDIVQVVDQDVRPGRGTLEKQRERGEEGEQGGKHVEARGEPITRQQRQQRRCDRRDGEHGGHRVEAHSRSPRKRSSAWTSTVSKRSRMRNRKIPMTMKAIKMEKATLISTTNGMPLAPVAASTRPFSSDMNPTTWLTTLRRVTIIRSPSSTTDSAKARSSRASGSASVVTRRITTMESATRPMPSSMVGPMPTTVSISR